MAKCNLVNIERKNILSYLLPFLLAAWVSLATERFQTALLIKKYEALLSRLFLAPSERNQNIQDNHEYNSALPFRIVLKIFAVNMRTGSPSKSSIPLQKVINYCEMVEVETVLRKFLISYETHYLKLLLSVSHSCTPLNHIDDSLAGNQSNFKKQENKPITFEEVITASVKCLSSEFFWSECGKIRTKKSPNFPRSK